MRKGLKKQSYHQICCPVDSGIINDSTPVLTVFIIKHTRGFCGLFRGHYLASEMAVVLAEVLGAAQSANKGLEGLCEVCMPQLVVIVGVLAKWRS